MASAVQDFATWLKIKLEELNTDETIFGSYIMSILDSDETLEEKTEALQSILSEIIQNEEEIKESCSEMLDRWQDYNKVKEPPPQTTASDEVDIKLMKLLESQSLATTKQKSYTEEEKKIREAVLKYSQMADDEDEGEDSAPVGDHHEGLEKNTNAQSVLHAERQKREQSKLDSQKKKDKDKEDREKQKQLKEDKKEKRKTQKQERKR